MNCCDDNGNCRQGRDCPIRRVRAGTEPPPDMPVQFAEGHEDDDPQLFATAVVNAAAAVALVLIVVIVVFAVSLLVYGAAL